MKINKKDYREGDRFLCHIRCMHQGVWEIEILQQDQAVLLGPDKQSHCFGYNCDHSMVPIPRSATQEQIDALQLVLGPI